MAHRSTWATWSTRPCASAPAWPALGRRVQHPPAAVSRSPPPSAPVSPTRNSTSGYFSAHRRRRGSDAMAAGLSRAPCSDRIATHLTAAWSAYYAERLSTSLRHAGSVPAACWPEAHGSSKRSPARTTSPRHAGLHGLRRGGDAPPFALIDSFPSHLARFRARTSAILARGSGQTSTDAARLESRPALLSLAPARPPGCLHLPGTSSSPPSETTPSPWSAGRWRAHTAHPPRHRPILRNAVQFCAPQAPPSVDLHVARADGPGRWSRSRRPRGPRNLAPENIPATLSAFLSRRPFPRAKKTAPARLGTGPWPSPRP
jgi:hypothetical protein